MSNTTIAIIDYGVGNLRSVEKAFAAVGVEVEISAEPTRLACAHALVLPGVGAFGDAINCLRARGFDELVYKAAAAGKPLLGICVGYQMLFDESDEFGQHKGLGLLPGRVVRFPETDLHVPHIGWNKVHHYHPHPLLTNIPDGAFFYFVHSYYVTLATDEYTLGVTDYGLKFAAIAGRDNILGVQFHPEKSQQAGLQLLKNFAAQL
ncbi:MAG: imidazole glycerol phosphate synthase subunit HisH [Acidobacteriota bacterium]